MKSVFSRWARPIAAVAALAVVSSCGLPQVGPNKRQIYSGSVQKEGDAFVVSVNDRVTRATAVTPALGFSDAFKNAGQLGSDTIRAGDVLGITVYENVDDPLLGVEGAPATLLEEVQVDGKGFIFIPYAGRIKAAGNTPDAIRRIITAKLGEQTPDPQVEVRRAAGDGATVSLIGEVGAAGVYPIERPTRTLGTMLARAGGVSVEPEIAQVTVVRGNMRDRIWFEDLFRNPELDIALRGGDQILVEEDQRSFTALGATGGQAQVRFETQNLSALEGLAQVGGLSAATADPTGVFVLRNEPAEIANVVLGRNDLQGAQRLVYVLDLTQPNGMFMARDFVIRDRDTLYVTEAPFAQWSKVISAITGTAGSVASLTHPHGWLIKLMGLGPEIYDTPAAETEKVRRLFLYNSGFLTLRRIRRILQLSGYSLHLGLPKEGDAVVVWGNSPRAHRGLSVAEKRGVPVVRVEDALLRSIHPGRAGEPPLGLLIDHKGAHFDPRQPSDLEDILANHPLDDTALLNRARGAAARMAEAHLSKYTGFDPAAPTPPPGYVLVIDQTQGDAAVTASGADRARFLEMLVFAQEEHPGCPVVIKTHPETTQGFRTGYFTDADANKRITLLSDPVSPWALFEGAVGVYTVSSQLGFEAIYAGHKPRVFGQPFYAGWGLTTDEFPVQRRQRKLTRAQLFAGAMILYPKWYDPYRDALCPLEDTQEALAAQTRAWREDHRGWVASGMRLWKRKPLQRFFGSVRPVTFEDDPAKARQTGHPWMVWAGKADVGYGDAMRVEDGFLRSKGLGAELVPPLSLVCDDLGIYYDPASPSRLEKWIEARAEMRPDQIARVGKLIDSLCAKGISKYNLEGAADLSDLPAGKRILVPGQVEDDASIRTGTGEISTNLALLEAARAANPDAVILYKPHPDVEAGLRTGAVDASSFATRVLAECDPISVLDQVDEVWTMTSLLGFEALLRGKHVVTFGAPFYAGWGLSEDRGDVPPRRRAEPSLYGLAHATLIDYPRYFDPKTGLACPVEVVVERLARGDLPRRGAANRLLSKLQGLFASQSHLWRR